MSHAVSSQTFVLKFYTRFAIFILISKITPKNVHIHILPVLYLLYGEKLIYIMYNSIISQRILHCYLLRHWWHMCTVLPCGIFRSSSRLKMWPKLVLHLHDSASLKFVELYKKSEASETNCTLYLFTANENMTARKKNSM